ncbi:MAG TPA: endonuclease III [Alphaproteobacteria bacterium]|nr:endonuclease III [Alphaproteobacteria bacterium]
MLKNQHIQEIFETFEQLNPAPTTELLYTNTYTLLVAVVLSAQSTDAGVNKATKDLFERASTPLQMLELGQEALTTYIKNVNYYATKAKNVIVLSEILVKDYNQEVPRTREELESLPGVGRKTANVVLNTAFGKPTLAVDTHVLRVSNRLGLSFSTTPQKVEEDLLACIPEPFKKNAHHWLILHGRYCCKAKAPLCATCPIRGFCPHV